MDIFFTDNIISVHKNGKEWLNKLPKLLEKLCADWGLILLSPFERLTYSYVVRVQHQNQTFVLKCTPPCERTNREIDWYLSGVKGCPSLLKYSKENGALLLEILEPGSSAKELVRANQDDEATRAIAFAIQNLETSEKLRDSFLHIREFDKAFLKLRPHVDATLVDKAQSLLKDLCKDTTTDCLLHGDIHHDNVLKSGKIWKVIDPHGYIGPKAFETGAMIRNPNDCFPDDKPLGMILNRRLDIMAEVLLYARDEIQAWSFVYTMIATAWSLGDHGEVPEEHLEILKLL